LDALSFACGIFFTLATEFIIVIVLAFYLAVHDKKKGGETDAEKDDPVHTGSYNNSGK